jgi:hypothetical protein
MLSLEFGKKPHAFNVVQKEPNQREIILATH